MRTRLVGGAYRESGTARCHLGRNGRCCGRGHHPATGSGWRCVTASSSLRALTHPSAALASTTSSPAASATSRAGVSGGGWRRDGGRGVRCGTEDRLVERVHCRTTTCTWRMSSACGLRMDSRSAHPPHLVRQCTFNAPARDRRDGRLTLAAARSGRHAPQRPPGWAPRSPRPDLTPLFPQNRGIQVSTGQTAAMRVRRLARQPVPQRESRAQLPIGPRPDPLVGVGKRPVPELCPYGADQPCVRPGGTLPEPR
eukprot:scaffold16995_cov127-Isochrysis_galbana.AAC.7